MRIGASSGKKDVPVMPDPRLQYQQTHPTQADSSGQPSGLEQAYRATDYCVDAPEGRLVIRIGQQHRAVEPLLARHDCSSWAYVTAHNPASQPHSAEHNQRRQRDLEEEVTRLGLPFYHGEAVAQAGNWPAEESLLILGIRRNQALDLAQRYGQAALLYGESGGSALLLWTSIARSQETA